MNKARLLRIDDEIKREVAKVISSELKDPRLGKLITVTRVKTTNDLKYCKIFVSIMGAPEEKAETKSALDKSAGFIRKQIASDINLRNTPELSFLIDDSLDEGFRISKLLDSIKKTAKSEEETEQTLQTETSGASDE